MAVSVCGYTISPSFLSNTVPRNTLPGTKIGIKRDDEGQIDSLSIFMDRSVQGRKVHTGYTALIEASTHAIQKTESRPDHNTGNFMPYSFRSGWVL